MTIGVQYMSARLVVVRELRQWTTARRIGGTTSVKSLFVKGDFRVSLKYTKEDGSQENFSSVALELERRKHIVRNLALLNLLQLLPGIVLYMSQL